MDGVTGRGASAEMAQDLSLFVVVFFLVRGVLVASLGHPLPRMWRNGH